MGGGHQAQGRGPYLGHSDLDTISKRENEGQSQPGV